MALSEFGRRHIVNAFKLPGKIVTVVEATLHGDIGDGHIGCRQQFHALADPQANQIFNRR